jgi:hypothetical protein
MFKREDKRRSSHVDEPTFLGSSPPQDTHLGNTFLNDRMASILQYYNRLS